jgi:hypothetical protein
MNPILWSVSLVGALALSGCGASAVSCSAPAMGAKVTCVEIDNPPNGGAAQAKQDCDAQMGVYADAPCDRGGLLGGCRINFVGGQISFSTTTWYYPSAVFKTTADVMAQCAKQTNFMFVAP